MDNNMDDDIPHENVNIKPYAEVRRVDEGEFFDHLNKLQDSGTLANVDVGGWIETNLDTPVANIGAAVCTEVYVLYPEQNILISGHYPETQPDKYSTPQLDNSVNNYNLMIARMEELNKFGYKGEAYLFGNDHAGTRMELERRSALSSQLMEHGGIDPSKLYDHRVDKPGATDSTIYDAKSRTILHKRKR